MKRFLLLLSYVEKIFIGEKSPRVCQGEGEAMYGYKIILYYFMSKRRAIEFQKIYDTWSIDIFQDYTYAETH